MQPSPRSVEVTNQVAVKPSWNKSLYLPGGATTQDVSDYNSMICEFAVTGDFGIRVRGQANGLDTRRYLPILDENRFLHPYHMYKTGRYYVDLSGIDTIDILPHPNRVDPFEAQFTLSTLPAPEPLDVPVRYKRITPEDGAVTGKFRAIEPLTDINLSPSIRYLEKQNNEGSLGVGFATSDIRLAGQPLFGPFSRVEITEGVALLVLL